MTATGPYQLLPPLSDEDYAALEKDILARGVLVPVEYDEAGNILDGHHRVAICMKHGLTDWPRFVRKGMTEAEKRSHARALNFGRRHLTTAQKREIIDAELREAPAASARSVAQKLGVDHKTVAAARGRLVAGGEIPHHGQLVGRDGVRQPAVKPIRTAFLPERANIPELKRVTKEIRFVEQRVRHAVRTDLAVQIAARQDATPWWREAGVEGSRAFPVIYADPPHRFETYSAITGGEKGAENHYPTMSIEEICALGCPAASRSVLFLWVTDLANGIRIMTSWGFVYKSFWAWKKIYPGKQTGTGYWGFDNCELLLIGTRGDFPAPLPGTQPIKCTDHAIGGHSQKPVWYAEQLERLYPDMPKLEMFQRKASLAPGDVRLSGQWSFWGNQSGAESEAA